MARKMDKHREQIAALADVRAEIEKLQEEFNARVKPLKAQEELLNAELVKAMVQSTEGTVDGRPAVEVVNVGRSTVTKARVLEHCPGLLEKLFIKNDNFKIKIV